MRYFRDEALLRRAVGAAILLGLLGMWARQWREDITSQGGAYLTGDLQRRQRPHVHLLDAGGRRRPLRGRVPAPHPPGQGRGALTAGRRGREPEFRLLVTGGGTGGHTYPALTTVGALTARLTALGIATRVVWAGNPDGLEAGVAASAGIDFQPLATGKVRRARTPWGVLTARNARDMAQVARGVVQARSIVDRFRPDVVLSTGGYAAVPIGVAARHLRRPLVVHEQTVRLGLANRVLVRGATRVAVSESSSLDLLPPRVRERAVVTGNPIRPALLSGESTRAIAALDLHAFDPDRPFIYVTGGAQGAVQINRLVSESLPWLLERANVIHQCGPSHLRRTGRARRRPAHAPECAVSVPRFHHAGAARRPGAGRRRGVPQRRRHDRGADSAGQAVGPGPARLVGRQRAGPQRAPAPRPRCGRRPRGRRLTRAAPLRARPPADQ